MLVIDISPEFRTLGNDRYMGSLRGHAGQQLELSHGHVAPSGVLYRSLMLGALCRLKHYACLDY